MSFAVDDVVKIKRIESSIHYDELIGLSGKIVHIHSEYSSGPNMCPFIAVDLGEKLMEVRFYPSELENVHVQG